MISSQIQKLQKIEAFLFLEKELEENVYYRRFDFYWIRSFGYPFEICRELQNISSIRKFPKLDMRAWAIWMFSILKTRSIPKTQLISLLGVIPAWFLMDKKEFSLYADFMYSRGNTITLIYPKEKLPCVVKTQLKPTRAFDNEVKFLQLANSISHPYVRTPEFISQGEIEDSNWFMQKLVQGKEITSFNGLKRKSIYDQVFEFMMLFYKQNGVRLKKPELDILLNKYSGSKFFNNENGETVLKKIKDLSLADKNMLFTITHNDLYHKNILVDKSGMITIIDWGNSKENYLVHDFKNKTFDKEAVFNRITQDLNLSFCDIYSFKEQVFIEEFIEVCEMIRKYSGKKNKQLYKYRIKSRLKTLKNKLN